MPGGRAKGQVERGGHVPGIEGDSHHNPAKYGSRYSVPKSAERRPNQKRANPITSEFSREPAQERQKRRTQQNQRRSDGHQQQMLHHMGRKEQVGKGIKRRSDR